MLTPFTMNVGSSCAQNRTTVQPASCRLRVVSKLRLRFLDIFVSQDSTLDLEPRQCAGAPVPKTPINEDGDSSACQHYVGSSGSGRKFTQ